MTLFLVQRSDCERFALAHDLDPGFSRALAVAAGSGLEVLAYGCEVSPETIAITHRLASPLVGEGTRRGPR